MTKRPYVSFADVKQRVSIPDVLEGFGILGNFQRKGDTLTGACPIHQHGPSPNVTQFKVNRKDGVWLWHCFGDCQRGGDVIELVKAVTGFDNAHVRFWFAERFSDRLILSKPSGERKEEISVEKDTAHEGSRGRRESTQAASLAPSHLPGALPALKPLRFRLDLDPNVPYLRERGLTPDTIARYGLGLCRRGLLKNYIAVPVHQYPRSEGTNPVAYLGRWPGEDYDEAAGRPRYKWPEGFPKSRVVYGLTEAMRDTDGRPLIVVEGPFNVFHLVQHGFRNTVSIFGASMGDEQADLLVRTGRPIVLLLDNDEAGKAGAWAAVEKIVNRAFVRYVNLPPNLTTDCLSPHHIEQLLS